MPETRRHTCPIPGCYMQISASRVMCRAHWLMVDPITQMAVREAYLTRPRSAEHVALVRDAVTQVVDQIGQVPRP